MHFIFYLGSHVTHVSGIEWVVGNDGWAQIYIIKYIVWHSAHFQLYFSEDEIHYNMPDEDEVTVPLGNNHREFCFKNH